MDQSIFDEAQKFYDDFPALMEKINSEVLSLVKRDEFLKDIGFTDVNTMEKCVDDAIALHHGQAIRLIVLRGNERLPITVSYGDKVRGLLTIVANAIDEKLAIERTEYQRVISKLDKRDKPSISRAFSLNPPPRRLNWRRFWRTHCLATNGTVMSDENALLKKIPGLSNNAVISFVRRNRKKRQ